MTKHEVTLVRVYLREAEYLLAKVIGYLHDEAQVRGVTVFRGIEGFSENGTLRTVSLLDLSLDLPLIVEFFDEPKKIEAVIKTLVDEMGLPHVISFSAHAYHQDP